MANFINRENHTTALFLSEARKYKQLSHDEERKLIAVAQGKGEESIDARNRIVNANLLFLVSKAKPFSQGEDLMDYVNEGALGLIEAITRFDLSKDVKLLTYATPWIMKKIREAWEKNTSCTSITDDVFKTKYKANKAFNKFVCDHGYEPTYEDLAEILNMKASRIEAAMNCTTSVSFDAPYGDDDDRTIGDKMFGDYTDEADFEANRSSNNAYVRSQLKYLTPREQEVVTQIFGIEGNQELKMGEIAERFGVSHESIRRTHERAKAKLKIRLGEIEYRTAC